MSLQVPGLLLNSPTLVLLPPPTRLEDIAILNLQFLEYAIMYIPFMSVALPERVMWLNITYLEGLC